MALASLSYVGNSAAGFGNSVRTAIFSLRFLGSLVREKWWLANCLEFLFLFVQAKRKREVGFGYFFKSIVLFLG